MRILQSVKRICEVCMTKKDMKEMHQRLPATGCTPRTEELSSSLGVHPRRYRWRRHHTRRRHHTTRRRRHPTRRRHHPRRWRERSELIRWYRPEPSAILRRRRTASSAIRIRRPPDDRLPDRHVTGRGSSDRWCTRGRTAAVGRLRVRGCVGLCMDLSEFEGVAELGYTCGWGVEEEVGFGRDANRLSKMLAKYTPRV